MELVILAMEEPPVTRPTTPGGGAHDEGDLMDASDGEEVWAMGNVFVGPTQATTEATGCVSSSAS